MSAYHGDYTKNGSRQMLSGSGKAGADLGNEMSLQTQVRSEVARSGSCHLAES